MKRIIYTQEDGTAAIIVPTPSWKEEGYESYGHLLNHIYATQLVGIPYSVVDVVDMPTNRTFRNAWKRDAGNVSGLKTDIPMAKEIAHDARRAKREEELASHDDIIAKQIPGKDAVAAEAARQVIRDKHAVIQSNINAATTEAELLVQMELLK